MEFFFASLNSRPIENSTTAFINFFLDLYTSDIMNEFIYKYFLDPINSNTGYNLINTLTYGIIAIICVYLIFKILERYKVKIEKEFIYGTLSFVLLGSTMRVVTDSIHTGVLMPVTFLQSLILNSHLYDYGYFTASPGIYLIVSFLFLSSFIITYKMKRIDLLKYIGLFLFAFNFLIILPFMQYFLYSIPVLILAAIPFLLALKYFKNPFYALVIAGQALDGAATFFVIDFFGKFTGVYYWEQHVFSRAVGDIFGTYFTFYLLKVLIAFLAVYFIDREKLTENEKNYIILILAIIGLAPGIRDVLRMIVGG